MIKYHHLGITVNEPKKGERYIPHLKMFVFDYTNSEFGIEWIRFDKDAPYPDLVKTVPHVAFVVEDLDAILKDKNVIIAPNSPSEGVRVAFIEENGAPIEFLEYKNV